MSDNVESLTWLTDPHLELCSYQTRHQLYDSINQAAGEIVIITGDLSAGSHRLAQYTELAEQIKKPVYFVLGNHDRYGTTFANTERVVERVTGRFSHMVRLNGSQIIPLNNSVALIGVDGWADGLGGEGPETKARINDFYQILDFATDPEPRVFREMKERAGKDSRALRPSLIRALKQYQMIIVATHVPPYEGAAWHEGCPSSPAYQPFFSSPTMGKMIKAAVADHPGKSVLVLCGHTHSSGTYCDGNVLVLTAGARYGFPEISKTIHLERLGSIFASSHASEPPLQTPNPELQTRPAGLCTDPTGARIGRFGAVSLN
jgi:predicted MPP superfamily phosphohydrolase